MLSRFRSLVLGAVCVTLSACAPAPINPDAITAAPEPGRAIIIGWGNTAAENARASLSAEWTTRVTRLFVAFADGRKMSFGENIARLEPGDRDLIISCGIYVNHRFFTYDSALRATLAANRVYRLRANPEGRRCEGYLEDVTGKSG
ncbi:MAG TPA: hypothetical protein VEW70_06560 [Burkholderiales bacterium]|jgi:hypothetical protein|nr:hypothetical protein [Burkholderiales bacterium]